MLQREDCHALRKALEFQLDNRWQKERPKNTLKRWFEEESMKVGLSREDAFCR